MNAAIKVLEDTLLIRRLQARELEHEKDNAARIASINEDIASLERGLAAFMSLQPTVHGLQPRCAKCPTIGDLPGKTAGGSNTPPAGGSSKCNGVERNCNGNRQPEAGPPLAEKWEILMKTLSNSATVENLSVLSNQFALLHGEWLVIPYGDHPHVQGIQRLTKSVAETMVNRFHSWRGQITRVFGGLPFYVGHPDDPEFANESPDKRAYGWIMELAARDDGLALNVKWNTLGEQTIANAEYKWFSPRWTVKEVARENGRPIFEPFWLRSAGLTNRPNIGVMPLSNEEQTTDDGRQTTENQNTKGDRMFKEMLITMLALAPDATDEQIKAALGTFMEKMKTDQAAATAATSNSAAALAAVETSLANEKTGRAAKETELQSEIANRKSEILSERRARIDLVLANAIAAGKITEAQKPQWAGDLEKDFAAKLAELSNAKPTVKTKSVTTGLGGRNSATVVRRDNILTLVNEQMQKTGSDYETAWDVIKKTHPALFEAQAKGG